MKPRHLQFLPRTLMVCVAPLLLCASAQAQVMIYNESNATGEWTVRAGTNLLAGATVVADSLNPADPVTPPPVQEDATSSTWATLSDGILGTPGGTTPPYKSQTVAPLNGGTVTYALDLAGHPDGYDLTSFDSYCIWGDGNRDDQNYAIQYSTDGAFFNNLATVANRNNLKATHTNLTDASGVLASGVKYVKIIFGASPAEGQENGYTGFSEFILRADPTNVVTTLESNISTAGFTLPAGTNLLNGATASPLTTAAHEGSSPDWTTVTNGLLGVGTDTAASVTPNNGTSVIFPLNTSVNFNGYNLTSIDTYSAWANSGRDNQMLNISYSQVGAESVFIPLGTAVINTGDPTSATHVKLSPAAGFLATGVAAIKFDTGHQENGYVGLREFIALGTAVSISDALTWTGASGSGGNANWIAGADSNWKKTIGGTAASFSPLAALTFDNLPTNRNISIPAPLTASSIALNNDATHPYTFGGSLVTVSNDILSTGVGTTTFNNPISAITGVTQSGSGQLVFNGALGASGATLSGTGGITLNAANPALTGTVAVSNGVLTVSHNGGLQGAGLSMSGFDATTALFTSAAPAVTSISSTLDSPANIILGKTAGTVNTNLTVGDAASVTAFRGVISQATGTVGSLTKTGASSLTLSGENTYSGPTSVLGGTLTFSQLQALYGGQPSAWTASNLVVGSGATLAFEVGDSGEFTEANIDSDLSLGGFAPGSFLGINTNTVDATLTRNLTRPGLGLVKSGTAILNLTGANTSNGPVKLFGGTLNADSTTGTAINGDLQIGKGLMNLVFNFGGNNQLAPTSVITFTNGNFYSSKVNLRGTNQTIAGLDGAAFPANKVTVIQNDEVGQPGYTEPPGDASLTINATSNHSFYGLIRNQDGGAVSVTKNGPGIQEFKNLHDIAGYAYTGPTLLNEGTLRINFTNSQNGFPSPVTIAGVATLNFHSEGGGYDFNPIVSGAGKVVVTGTNPIALTNGGNSWTGGTTVDGGFLALKATNANGQGDGPGQTCVGGAMDPSNLINLINGGTLSLDNAGALGNSPVLPQYAPTIHVNEGSKIYGGTNTIAFVSNITLDGGKIEATNGASVAGFNTNLCLVGTVIVGGVSTLPSQIITTGTGPNANVSLGSMGLPGTTFQVADVGVGSDLVVGSILTNVNVSVSSLTKTGPGTLELQAGNTYTGPTRVVAGELRANIASFADSADVVVDTGATLNLQFASVDTISRLTLGGATMAPGIYGSVANATPGISHTPFITGSGMLYVTSAGSTDPYELWDDVIPNAADRDRTDDPDGDGFTNLQEYLFGTSPIANTGALSTIEKSGSNLIIRWSQRTPGTYVVQESATLMVNSWGPSAVAPTNAADQSGLYSADYVRKEAIIPIDSAKKFIRVKATE